MSYLDNPLFGALQFHEVTNEIAGLERVDLLIAGAVSSDQSFYSRVEAMSRARAAGQHGARAIGATFHQRPLALVAQHYGMLDISFIRYNSAHPGASRDLFPYLSGRNVPVFNSRARCPKLRRKCSTRSSWVRLTGDPKCAITTASF